MDKKIAGMIGAVSALVTLDASHAATAPQVNDVMAARSYADLLAPIPNAVPILKASDAQEAARAESGARMDVAYNYHHHRYFRHHHHHHRVFRHYRHHHHRYFRG